MRNPGETSKSRAESETTSEAGTEESERDDCSSPPCKRLKQAVLPFSRSSSPPSTSSYSFKSPVSLLSNGTDSINPGSKLSCEEKVNGGLVTGAPSPPDVKENSVKLQVSSDPTKVSKSLILENCVKTQSGEKDAAKSSISSPKANASCVENELMIIDQSPPAKVNSQKKVNDGMPLLKSAEKQKRKEEREKERQEKQRLREEKLKEKQEAKAMKEKERLEAKRKREEEKQEKQAEKERKEKERMEKREKEEKERLEKKGKKDEEKRKRDEERNAKIEEKRKREAEKRSLEEEQERKRQKIQENFANFFSKPPPSTPKVVQTENNSRFKAFEIKAGMSLAPVIRRQLSLDIKKVLDEGLSCQKVSELYLKELENRKPILRYTKRKLSSIAENTENKPEEIINIDENSNSSIEIIEPKKNMSMTVGLRCKLLQFHKNYRPAYFGTWRRRSKKISPKNPFKKDMELLDYEVDSDDEWEEEEPGESLSNSEGEDEADGDQEDNEGDDDGFFVPHGYLSDDEGVEDEEMEDAGGENKEQGTNSENKKDQQLAKAKAWEAEMKRKCKPMKPVTVGCLWLEDAMLNLTLKRFAACLLVDGPIDIDSSTISSKNSEVPVDATTTMNSGALYVPDEAMPDLIKLIHGNTAGLNKLISQFRKQWTSKCLGRDLTDEEVNDNSPISKRQLEKKIQNIATKERRTDRLRWYVHNHVLVSFGLENIVVADGLNIPDGSADVVKIPVSPYITCNTPSIMQFTKPVSPALHTVTSPEQTQQTSKITPAGALHNSPSPMEVDSTSPSLNVTHCQPTQLLGFSSGENSKSRVENNLNNSQISKPSLFTAAASTSKTETVTSQNCLLENV